MNDSSPDEIVVELAQRLFDEAAAFSEQRGGMTAADTGGAIAYLINAGYEALGDCPGESLWHAESCSAPPTTSSKPCARKDAPGLSNARYSGD
jgi:hypothetical protein